MKISKSLITILVGVLILLASGCFNDKDNTGDSGKGVKIQRSEKGAVVLAVDTSVGTEVTIKGIIEANNISSENIIITKQNNGNTMVAVAGTGKTINADTPLFTIKNAPETLNIEVLKTIKNIDANASFVKRVSGTRSMLGDFNGDNAVDLLDLSIFKTAYSSKTGGKEYSILCDVAPAQKLETDNGETWGMYNVASPDGQIDIIDFVIFANNIGKKPTFIVMYDLWTNVKKANTDVNGIISDLDLVATSGTDTIKWTSSNTAAISNTGGVTRGISDTSVTLTATITRYNGLMIATKTLFVVVKGNIINTDQKDVDDTKTAFVDASIKGTNADLNTVTTDLVLPITLANGITLSWTSDTPAVITNAGKVTQNTTDKTVKLTVTFTKNAATATKTLTAIVKAKVIPPQGITIYVDETYGNQIYAWTDAPKVEPLGAWAAATNKLTNKDREFYYYTFDKSLTKMNFVILKDGTKVSLVDQATTATVWYDKTGKTTTDYPYAPSAPKIAISPATGATFTTTIDVTISATGTNVTTVKYTLDGTEPSETVGTAYTTGTKITFGSDMAENDTKTIKVFAKNDVGPATATAAYTKTKEIVVTNDFNNLRMYQVMVSAFQDGDSNVGYNTGYGPSGHRGDLRGIINALPYIKSLGCNALWMTPIFDSSKEGGQTGSTGYFTNNYFAVDPHFGSDADLKELIEKCHSAEYNMYVILDGVFGHYGGSGLQASPSGKYPSGSSGWVDYPGSLDFYKEVATYWIDKYDIDGWRLDQAYQVNSSKNKSTVGGTSYWKDIRTAVETKTAEKKAAGKKWGTLGYMVGEIWDNETIIADKGYGNDGLRSCFDFPLRYRIVQTLAEEEWRKKGTPASNLTSGLEAARLGNPSYALPNMFLTNHDVARFGNLIKDAYPSEPSANYWKRHKAALSFIAAESGPMTIYYGDEIGQLSPGSFPAPDNKSPNDVGAYMDNWSRNDGKITGLNTDEANLKDYTASIMKLRTEHPALWNGKRTSLIGTEAVLFADLKVSGSDKIVYTLNVSTTAATATIPQTLIGGTTLKDALGTETITAAGGNYTIPVDSLTGKYYIVQ